MPQVSFTQEDLLARKQLDPGWRTLEVKDVTEGAGKSNPATTTYTFHFVICEGLDKGVPLKAYFNDGTQMDRLAEFVRALRKGQPVEASKNFELNDAKGKKIQGYCFFDEKMDWNAIKSYKPAA